MFGAPVYGDDVIGRLALASWEAPRAGCREAWKLEGRPDDQYFCSLLWQVLLVTKALGQSLLLVAPTLRSRVPTCKHSSSQPMALSITPTSLRSWHLSWKEGCSLVQCLGAAKWSSCCGISRRRTFWAWMSVALALTKINQLRPHYSVFSMPGLSSLCAGS